MSYALWWQVRIELRTKPYALRKRSEVLVRWLVAWLRIGKGGAHPPALATFSHVFDPPYLPM